MKLSEGQRFVLGLKPFLGFAPGSNVWPLTHLVLNGMDVDGEEIDDLLRRGLLSAEPLEKEVQGQRSPDTDIAPHLDFDHRISASESGRQALDSAE